MTLADNPFLAFKAAGYTRLVSITPPGAKVSERSSLAKRTKDLGKAPGIRKADGDWIGYDWLKHQPTDADFAAWHAAGAGVGIRTGGGLVALDIDSLDAAIVDDVMAAANVILGPAPIRYGRRPKALLLYRLEAAAPYRRVKGEWGLVELLTEGRQFVASGIHPVTQKPYEWVPYLMPAASLTTVTEQQLDRLFAHIAERWGGERATETGPSERAAVDQAQLLGEPETVKAAVEALPNTSALFPTYDDYVRVGYAIKAATQDDDEGLRLFQSWAAKWADGENDPDRVAADWSRMHPPYSVGAQYLYSLASKHSGGNFTNAEAWFTGQGTQIDLNPFETATAEEAKQPLEPIRWANLSAWHTTEAPKAEWEVEGLIPRNVVTLLYGDGGVGKTLAIHQYAIAAAAGVSWLGQKTRPARVMCVFCEDEEDELHRRHRAILKATQVEPDAIGDRLRIVSRSGEDNILAAYSRSTGTMQRTAFWHQLCRDAVDWRADVVIVDTLADTFGGSEIDRGQVNQFVKYALGGLGRAIGGSAIGLGHPSVAGRKEGRSGSTAWSNAARSRIYLRRPEGREKGNLRELEGMKTNRGALGHLLQIEWKAGAFSLVAESRPIDPDALKSAADALRDGAGSGGKGGGQGRGASGAGAAGLSLEAREEAAVLLALAEARREGRPLNLAPTSSAYAPRVLLRDYPDLLGAVRAAEIDGTIGRLLRSGRVRADEWASPGHRNKVKGFAPVAADTADVFE